MWELERIASITFSRTRSLPTITFLTWLMIVSQTRAASSGFKTSTHLLILQLHRSSLSWPDPSRVLDHITRNREFCPVGVWVPCPGRIVFVALCLSLIPILERLFRPRGLLALIGLRSQNTNCWLRLPP